MLPAMDAPSAPAFDRLDPAAQDYASRPVASALQLDGVRSPGCHRRVVPGRVPIRPPSVGK